MDYLLENKDKEINDENSNIYNLYAITVHVGQGNEYGHYYCLLKIANRWLKFDDEIVSVIIVFNTKHYKYILDNIKRRNQYAVWKSR